MWTRKELKQRGKQAFSLNYWKTVLVALIIAVLAGGMGMSGNSGAIASGTSALTANSDSKEVEESVVTLPDEFNSADQSMDELPEIILQEMEQAKQDSPAFGIFSVAFFGLLIVVFLVILAIAILIGAFLFNPLEVGCRKFCITNLHTAAEVKEVAFGYDHCYKNNVKTLFLRDLYIVLWSLLFIIPGIVKSYSYRMMPYILAEHPELSTQEVFERSKAMMHGQKWRAFVLDLSFIGWYLLSFLTMGILSIFYVNPYKQMTNAALYEALAYGNTGEVPTVWTES